MPQIVGHDYIELEMVKAISKFRSCEGHEYSDDFETGSSMKHYFKPRESVDWAEIPIYSPINGEVIRIVAESWPSGGQQILIQSSEYPAFIFQLFHVQTLPSVRVGQGVVAGQMLGHHIGRQTLSDIAIDCHTSAGRRNVSYFQLMPDSVFEGYRIRGVASRGEMIISPEYRGANPCTFGQGNPIDWVVLRRGTFE